MKIVWRLPFTHLPRACAHAQIAEDGANNTAAEAEPQEASAADEGEDSKHQSILQMKLRKVVVLIGKAG